MAIEKPDFILVTLQVTFELNQTNEKKPKIDVQYLHIKQQQLRNWKGFLVGSKSKRIKGTVASKMTPYAPAALPNIFEAPLSQPGVRDVPWKMVTDWHHLAHPAGDRLLSVRANTGCSHPGPADGTTHPHVGGLGDRTQSASHHSPKYYKAYKLKISVVEILIIEGGKNFPRW